jgi:hypothetical protein
MSEELGTFKKVIHIPAGDVPASVISVNSCTATADKYMKISVLRLTFKNVHNLFTNLRTPVCAKW